MGQGDVLMSMGEAKRLHARKGKSVLILRPDGMPVKSDLFAGVPYLVHNKFDTTCARMINGPARGLISPTSPTPSGRGARTSRNPRTWSSLPPSSPLPSPIAAW